MTIYQCDNCSAVAPYDQLPDAVDLLERLDDGGVFTSKQCAACGALAYPCSSVRVAAWPLTPDSTELHGGTITLQDAAKITAWITTDDALAVQVDADTPALARSLRLFVTPTLGSDRIPDSALADRIRARVADLTTRLAASDCSTDGYNAGWLDGALRELSQLLE